MARKVVALHRPTSSSEKHAAQWESSLATYVFSVIGRVPVDAVTTNHVLAVLEPIWNAKPETATRVRQRMQMVFEYAIASGWRTDNPALWPCPRCSNGGASAKMEHHPAMPYGRAAGIHDRPSERPPRTRSPGWGWSF